MPAARLPEDEDRRLASLLDMQILDTAPEASFNQIVRLVARLFDVPIALISLVDKERQWFKARVGLDTQQTPRSEAFCAHTILEDRPFLIPDATQDPRFADNPLVQGTPDIRFYLGVPLVTAEGARIGTLCVIDQKPRTPSPDLVTLLQEQAHMVVSQMELRRTARKLAERNMELASANEKLESFTRALSHDIMGPIRQLQHFHAGIAPMVPAEYSDDLKYMSRAIHRLHQLVESLNEYVSSSGQLALSDVPLNGTVEAVLADLKEQLESVGAAVQVSPLPTVRTHPLHLQRVLTNLLGNAIKYRSERPLRITVSARRSGEFWRVSISDNGIGIAPRFLQRIFVPLERLHRHSQIPGSGLGLALCHQVITACGGTIGVESEPEVGSTFWFELPPADDPEGSDRQ